MMKHIRGCEMSRRGFRSQDATYRNEIMTRFRPDYDAITSQIRFYLTKFEQKWFRSTILGVKVG